MLIPKGSTGLVGRGGLYIKKFSPEILTGVGLVGMSAGAFLAVKATTRLESVVSAAELRILEVKELQEMAGSGEVEPYSDYAKDLRKAYIKNVMEFTKLYGPALSLFLSGAGAVLAAHGIMRKRNVALVAAYNAVKESFDAYRARVIEDLGEEKDRDYRYGITETTEKGADGKKETSTVVDPNKMSRYARVFDETNPMWEKQEGYNQFFLTSNQNYLNDKLRATGHVFLNEVYERLGFEHTKEGAVVGWVIGNNGDNYIDLGIYDASTQEKRNFINGYERSIWINPNVDGVILDLI